MTAVGIKAGDRVRVRPSHLQDPRVGVVEFVGDQEPRHYGEPYSVGVRLDDGGYRDREVLGFRLSELEPLDTPEHENAPEAAPTATGGDTQDRANGPEHNIQSTSEEQNVMTSIAPTPSPVEPHTSTPRVIRGTDFPAGREVASVSIVDPDSDGALIKVKVGEYLTPEATHALARDLHAAACEATVPNATMDAVEREVVDLGDRSKFPVERTLKRIGANVAALIEGDNELHPEILVGLADVFSVDPATLLKRRPNLPSWAETTSEGRWGDESGGWEYSVRRTREADAFKVSIQDVMIVYPDSTTSLGPTIDVDVSLDGIDPATARALAAVLVDMAEALELSDAVVEHETVDLGDEATFTPGRSQRNLIANVCAALDGQEVDLDTLAGLANVLGVDPVTLVKDPAPARTEEV